MDKDIEKWKNRYTVKRFDENFIPSNDQIQHIVDVIKYIPSQESRFDHIWLVLSPKDKKIKKWLTSNVFYHDNDLQGREYMIQVLTAPYVFLCVTFLDNSISILDCKRNIGIHAGSIMSEALFLGLDVATIGCTTGTSSKNPNRDDIEIQFNRLIKEKFKQSINDTIGRQFKFDWTDSKLFQLDMAVGIGKGMPLVKKPGPKQFTKHNKFRYFPGQKSKKNIKNVIYLNDQDKEE